MSKKYIIPLLMIGTLAASSAAFAADQATGEIRSLNAAKHRFTLADGQIGQTVTVTYDIKNRKSVASSVAMVEPEVFTRSEERGGESR